jgi:hypothetical protein
LTTGTVSLRATLEQMPKRRGSCGSLASAPYQFLAVQLAHFIKSEGIIERLCTLQAHLLSRPVSTRLDLNETRRDGSLSPPNFYLIMFSGTSTPPKATRTPRRTGTRASRAAIAASGETTPRASPPPSTSASLHPNRSLGHNLHAASRALSASPAPSMHGSRRTRSVAATSEAGSAMDLDDRERAGKGEEDKVLVRDDSYVVLEKKGLPAEVEQVIRAAGEQDWLVLLQGREADPRPSAPLQDPYTDPFRATLDSQTGFALLVSREHCFVWNWAKVRPRSACALDSSSPTLHSYSAPLPQPPTSSLFLRLRLFPPTLRLLRRSPMPRLYPSTRPRPHSASPVSSASAHSVLSAIGSPSPWLSRVLSASRPSMPL